MSVMCPEMFCLFPPPKKYKQKIKKDKAKQMDFKRFYNAKNLKKYFVITLFFPEV